MAFCGGYQVNARVRVREGRRAARPHKGGGGTVCRLGTLTGAFKPRPRPS